jgi:hypothetical protein
LLGKQCVTKPQRAVETLRYKVFEKREGYFQSREIMMNNEFQMVCRDCSSLGIKIENPVDASPETVVTCTNCGKARGTIGSLRELAARLQALGHSTKQKSSELVSRHRELQSLRRKVQTDELTTRAKR